MPESTACTHCGATIAPGVLFVREGAAYCCEHCYLGRRLPAVKDDASGDPYMRFAEALAETLDLREHETGLHSKRVACHTQVLARRFFDAPERLHQIYWGSLLHDIGKIGIADAILLKQGPLDDAEWDVMCTHAELGRRIIALLPGMGEAAAIVGSHEEHFDGSGYPRGLAGDAIPFGARLFAVIDALDAMTSDRPYRSGLPFDSARDEIVRLAGRQFDPQAVDAFLAEETTLREMVALKCGPAEFLAGGMPPTATNRGAPR